MFKKVLFSFVVFTVAISGAYSQAITVTNISSSGHFSSAAPTTGCGMGLPVVTATYLSGTGSTVSGGVITCTNQCGSTTVRITLSNVRWTKFPANNWLHGISFTPGNVTVGVPPGGLPAGWAPFTSSTGSCASPITTGVGFYFDAGGQACCPGMVPLDGIPGNNYGDPVADCNFDYTFFFDLTFCNSSITTNPLVFSARGTSDYQTGCWTGVDNIATSRIQFVLSTTPCTVPIYSTAPSAAAPVKDCTGPTVNYTSTLTAGCGSGSNVTWWTASTLGTQLGSGSPFVYDPAGSVCPGGTTVYAACCPVGSTCAARVAVGIPNTCVAALSITNVATTNPTCSDPNGSINSVTVANATGTVTYTLNPGGASNTTGVFPGLTGTNYTLTAVDAGGCTATANVVFTPGGGSTVPTFTQVAPICSGGTLAPLPTTSNNGFTGTWSPALNNTATTPYTFTPSTGQCATTATMTITVNQPVTPTFTQVAPICSGQPLSPLPTTSNNGISGTWSPAVNNTTTTPYTFTPTAGQCATTATMTITVNSTVTPTFTQRPPVCSGTVMAPLPTTSNNGITGTWSPALNNTATTPYTFTPAAGQCATTATMTITVNSNVTPTFTQVAPICSGGTLVPLPTTSNNGITGTWSPALNNTATTPYTFTPSAGQCATTATMTITVNTQVTPTFTQIAPICSGGTLAPLPTTSNNGITGTWSPALNNTATTPYTFTPTTGQCATTATMTITVNSQVTPIFTQVAPICLGGTLAPLPTTSNNGITGTWSPALNNTATTPYTFTPATSQCASTATMTITVNTAPPAPIVTSPLTYCQNAVVPALTATGNGLLWYNTLTGGTGSLSAPTPSTTTSGTNNYYVSQSTGTCEGPRATITVNVINALTANAGPSVTIQSGAQTSLNGSGTPGANYLWTANGPLSLTNATVLNPVANPTQTTIYTLTVSAASGLCPSASDSMIVTVETSCVNVRNAFTPNGDGINDTWLVYDQAFCLQPNSVRVNVFNRYGNTVFESQNYTNNWNGTYKGKPVPDGTYYGVVEFTLANGNKRIVKTDLTLLR